MPPIDRDRTARHPAWANLHAFADGASGPASHLAVARHLADCASCSALVERFSTLAAQVAALPAAEPPDDFAARVLQRVRLAAPPPRRSPALRIVAPILALVASFAAWEATAPAVRVAEGIGRFFRPGSVPISEIGEIAFTLAATALGGLGRAMDGLLSPPAALPALEPLGLLPHLPLLAVAGLVLLAAAAAVALGRLRLRAARG